MTNDRIDAVLDRVHSWPKKRQEDAVRVLLAMEAEGTAEFEISPEEEAELRLALEDVAQGKIQPDNEVEAFFARHLE